MKDEKQNLKIVKLRIDSLTMDPENAKLHPDFQVQQIKKSIVDFGMNDPIGVWGENNLIVEGHGRVMALQQLGETEIDCIRLDHLTNEQRIAYAITHNSTNMSTGIDNSLLLQLIETVKHDFNMEDYGIVLTKLDGTAKGGIVIAVANSLQIPVKYVGVGEQMDDLMPFDPAAFVEALV